MYKVFVDNTPIYFQKAVDTRTNLPLAYFPKINTADFETLRKELYLQNNATKYFVASQNPKESMLEVFKNFNFIEAAGGIVKNNTTQKLLFIYKKGKWDLPKGKIEAGESSWKAAIREVSEECGLNNVQIVEPLLPTFHAFHAYDNFWLKKTNWFSLQTPEMDVTPQIEEEITKVEWMDNSESVKINKNTYASIIEVLSEYLSK